MAAGLDDVRRIALGLPRAYEAMVRDYVKFRVGSIVFASVSPDESLLGFGFPREEREALVAANPSTFLMPVDSDLRLMTVWVIRAGKHGEREQWCLENNAAGGGWEEVGDLSGCRSREDVRKLVDEAFPGTTMGLRANWTGQLWGSLQVSPGDIVILPLKSACYDLHITHAG